MQQRAAAWSALAAIALLVAAGLLWLGREPSTSDKLAPAPLATPPGITLQTLTRKNPAAAGSPPDVVYADANGMTLYTYDKDAGRVPGCTGACAEAWPPALAPANATPVGDWSTVSRTGATRQWAHRGRPLYRSASDTTIGAANGDGADSGSWHAAVLRPGADIELPADVLVRDLAAGGGIGLTDAAGITLYVQDGDAAHPPASRHWSPLEAPAIANPVGEFSIIARDDGITQWAWRGRPLYRFDADQSAGDFYGAGVEARFSVALLARHFMPADAAIRRTSELGYLLTTTSGATLYEHDRAEANDSLKILGAHRGPPETGRALGTVSCDAACSRTWTPFVAPAGATPSGYWSIAMRADGTRQWVYKGFALYTYSADQPGDLRGHGIHELVQIGDVRADRLATGRDAGTPIRSAAVGGATAGLGIGALYWHAVAP